MSKAALRRLYDELPTIECQGKCQDSCGPIGMSDEEYERICRHLGRPISDAGKADQGVRIWPPPPDLTCPLLGVDGRCTIYRLRPLICRLWGVVESMPCPYGCRPQPRYLTNREGFVLLQRADGMTAAEAEAFIGYGERRGFLEAAEELYGLSRFMRPGGRGTRGTC